MHMEDRYRAVSVYTDRHFQDCGSYAMCSRKRELTMKHIMHAAGSGGVLNVEHTSYRNVRTIIKKYSRDQIKDDELERECGTYGGRREIYRAL